MLVYNREKGQGLVEYALIMIMVAMVVIVTLALLGPTISNTYQHIIEQLPG
jgi:pilus assembly protein Flp/PilA